MIRGRRAVVRSKLAVVTTSLAAALLVLGAGHASAASKPTSCASGSVDGPAPQTAMCFGRMFPHLRPLHYSGQAAADLAAKMKDPRPDRPGTDRGTSDDSATLPSEYTYLGQFIDHNLDFDETPQPSADVNPRLLTNFESFRFDLNNVFGGGPRINPQLYASDHKHLLMSGTLGAPQVDGFPAVSDHRGVFDLARSRSPGRRPWSSHGMTRTRSSRRSRLPS